MLPAAERRAGRRPGVTWLSRIEVRQGLSASAPQREQQGVPCGASLSGRRAVRSRDAADCDNGFLAAVIDRRVNEAVATYSEISARVCLANK